MKVIQVDVSCARDSTAFKWLIYKDRKFWNGYKWTTDVWDAEWFNEKKLGEYYIEAYETE